MIGSPNKILISEWLTDGGDRDRNKRKRVDSQVTVTTLTQKSLMNIDKVLLIDIDNHY